MPSTAKNKREGDTEEKDTLEVKSEWFLCTMQREITYFTYPLFSLQLEHYLLNKRA